MITSYVEHAVEEEERIVSPVLIYESLVTNAIWLIPNNEDYGVCIADGSWHKVGHVFTNIRKWINSGHLVPFEGAITLEVDK